MDAENKSTGHIEVIEEGKQYIKNQDYARAKNVFMSILVIDPNNVEANIFYGISLINLGQIEDGLQHIDKALKIDPKNQYGLYYKAETLLKMGRYIEARDVFKTILTYYPDEESAASGLRECEEKLMSSTKGLEIEKRSISHEEESKDHEISRAKDDEKLKILVKRKYEIVYRDIKDLESKGTDCTDLKEALKIVISRMQGDEWEEAFTHITEVEGELTRRKLHTLKMSLGPTAKKMIELLIIESIDIPEYVRKYLVVDFNRLKEIDSLINARLEEEDRIGAEMILNQNKLIVDKDYERVRDALGNALLDINERLIKMDEQISKFSEFDRGRFESVKERFASLQNTFSKGDLVATLKGIGDLHDTVSEWEARLTREWVRHRINALRDRISDLERYIPQDVITNNFALVLATLNSAKRKYDSDDIDGAIQYISRSEELLKKVLRDYIQQTYMVEYIQIKSEIKRYFDIMPDIDDVKNATYLMDAFENAVESGDIDNVVKFKESLINLMDTLKSIEFAKRVEREFEAIDNILALCDAMDFDTSSLTERFEDIKRMLDEGQVFEDTIISFQNDVSSALSNAWNNFKNSVEKWLGTYGDKVGYESKDTILTMIYTIDSEINSTDYKSALKTLNDLKEYIDALKKNIAMDEMHEELSSLRGEIHREMKDIEAWGLNVGACAVLMNQIDEAMSIKDPQKLRDILDSIRDKIGEIKIEIGNRKRDYLKTLLVKLNEDIKSMGSKGIDVEHLKAMGKRALDLYKNDRVEEAYTTCKDLQIEIDALKKMPTEVMVSEEEIFDLSDGVSVPTVSEVDVKDKFNEILKMIDTVFTHGGVLPPSVSSLEHVQNTVLEYLNKENYTDAMEYLRGIEAEINSHLKALQTTSSKGEIKQFTVGEGEKVPESSKDVMVSESDNSKVAIKKDIEEELWDVRGVIDDLYIKYPPERLIEIEDLYAHAENSYYIGDLNTAKDYLLRVLDLISSLSPKTEIPTKSAPSQPSQSPQGPQKVTVVKKKIKKKRIQEIDKRLTVEKSAERKDIDTILDRIKSDISLLMELGADDDVVGRFTQDLDDIVAYADVDPNGACKRAEKVLNTLSSKKNEILKKKLSTYLIDLTLMIMNESSEDRRERMKNDMTIAKEDFKKGRYMVAYHRLKPYFKD